LPSDYSAGFFSGKSVTAAGASVKDLPEFITEFDERLWAGLAESITVNSKDRIVFRLTCWMKIES